MRWERPTARSFWNALADPEREALAAAGVEEFFRAGAVLCRAGDDTTQVMIIDSGWVKVAVRDVAPPDTRTPRAPNGSRVAAAQAASWQRDWREPLNCSIVFTDVAGFSDPVRNDSDRDVVRAAMYEILRSAFDASGVPWAACYREDRGDGAVIVVPPTISTHRVVDPLAAELADRLRQYNRRASEVVRIQLRVALHAGPVGRDAEGLTGQAVIAAARIVDAPVIKARLAAEQADLVFAASDYVYDHVVPNCGGRVDPAAFEHMECQVSADRTRPLLLVLSCFAPATPIPAWLLQLPPLADLLADRTGPEKDNGSEKDNGAERRGLRAGLQGLSRTGLIDISNGGSPAGGPAVTVHPVVADVNRIRLAASADTEHALPPGHRRPLPRPGLRSPRHRSGTRGIRPARHRLNPACISPAPRRSVCQRAVLERDGREWTGVEITQRAGAHGLQRQGLGLGQQQLGWPRQRHLLRVEQPGACPGHQPEAGQPGGDRLPVGLGCLDHHRHAPRAPVPLAKECRRSLIGIAG